MRTNMTDLKTILLLAAFIGAGVCTTIDIDQDLLEEGQRIQKRFADEFDGHTIALTSHDSGTGRFRRSTNGDINGGLYGEQIKKLKFELASGGALNFVLREAPVASAETEVVYHTKADRVRRQSGQSALGNNCFVAGTSASGGAAAFSLCDGLFGLATADGFDYLIHPTESQRSKRDVSAGHRVHVLWRRSSSISDANVAVAIDAPENKLDDDIIVSDDDDINVRSVNTEDTSLVVEMAIFTDSHFWQRIQQLYPGREDTYLLTRVAATQALFGDRHKVGYDFKIKVKLIEYWTEDPVDYNFQEDLGQNLKSFKNYVRDRYSYDMHVLNTGITQQKDAKIGLAYGRSACSRIACFATLQAAINAFSVYAHELGHTLGLSHPWESPCPENLVGPGSFMGGRPAPYDFTRCNKWEMDQFLNTGKGSCLFEETIKSKTPSTYQNLPSAFPGQWRTPDEMCRLFSGKDYVYYSSGSVTGPDVCKKFYCLNDKKKSVEYGSFEQKSTPFGLPCGEEMFCYTMGNCLSMNSTEVGWDADVLRASAGISEWSDWTKRWSSCSRKCGTGIKRRQRVCKKTSLNLKPYCEGPAFQARLCNKKPCQDDPVAVEDLIQARGDEVCQRLKKDNPRFSSYTSKATIFNAAKSSDSKSCMLTCEESDNQRSPQAVLPDGTICKDSPRTPTELNRLDIELRCVSGHCVEFSDCPAGQFKDSCGICDGGDRRCVTIPVNSSYDVGKRERSLLAIIPAGSTYIDVSMRRSRNRFVTLELWSKDDECIIGKSGKYDGDVFEDDTAIKHAGSKWDFHKLASYLRTAGPTKADVQIKALRGNYPITEITIRYARPEV